MKKSDFDRQLKKLRISAEKYVLLKIQNICKKKQIVFKSVYGYSILDELNGNDVDCPQIDKLITWYNYSFGSIGAYVCNKGIWENGQTALIQFSKPKL